MKFCWTTLHVKSLEESIRFYHEIIGLNIIKQFETGPDMKIAMLGEQGNALIELIEQKGISLESRGISIGFEVASIDEAMEQLKKNHIGIKSGPFLPVPSTTFFFVEDPDGMEVQIVQHG
ncbi:VOC family protein [Clostridium boliviensis]|uniref:VOC family protein n=1 Tax=Clostridium boliviensis TaxID=318465 RepID=A0ABU4GEM0_9CLOT|nr:VOC family protein [Clostridium boliviensis]MDW2796068.1 VOC family protein [Clostridium boliviensis]